MENQTNQQPQIEEYSKRAKWLMIGIPLGIVLLIIIVVAFSKNTPVDNPKVNNKVEVATNIIDENIPNEDKDNKEIIEENQEENKSGLITRSEIIALFPELKFTKETPVDGKDNYPAQSANNLVIIQLIGPEEGLTEISIMTFMGTASVNEMDVNDSYRKKILAKLTPNIKDNFPDIMKEEDNTTSDGFNVKYTYASLSSVTPGGYSEAYVFNPIK